ncbi:MAG: hypothetical protein KAS32_21330 [Candidatus Peribacteraceae bacterium]|nr:hypothetical protein [Candidatus Peribacteraceae bacterium]
MKLSVPIIARNVVKLKYPLDKVIRSVVGLADEVLILADPTSEDDTLDYIFDLSLEINNGTKEHGTEVVLMDSVWDLDNISSTGAEFARQTNISINLCSGDWVFCIQCDESIHEEDHEIIRILIEEAEQNGIDAYSMIRIYFYGTINTVRNDWTLPITRLFKKGTRYSCGDAMNTEGSGRVVACGVPIYHYSRIGDPEVISKRILSLDKFFHAKEKLLNENELKPYDFNTHNFDCMHKENIDVGRQEVKASFSRYTGTHPSQFIGYKGEE